MIIQDIAQCTRMNTIYDQLASTRALLCALYPCMPAQVFFLAGERTIVDYFLPPVIDAKYRAFREE